MFEYSDRNATIRTRRLELIPLLRTHADELFPVLADDALYIFTQDSPPASHSALRDRFARLETRRSPDESQLWLNWLVRSDGEAIGYVQATVKPDSTDIGWVIGSSWQRFGYATEAAGAMISWLRTSGVMQIRACIHPDHAASRRVAEKIGLVPTESVVDGETVWVFGEKSA